MIGDDSIVKLIKEPEMFDLAGERAMVDFDTGKYYLLKGPANDIWEKIKNEICVKTLVDSLLEAYDTDRETCMNQTVAFLEQLKAHGIAEIKC